MPPTSPPPPTIFTTECRTLAPPTRAQALALLLHRFSSTLRTKDNALLIRRLFGEAHGAQHCYHSRQDLPSSSPTLAHYRCAIAMRGAECVGAACFRHVAPRRAAAERTFTELLLLAVRSDVERQRIGSALVHFVKAEASRAHSRALLVVSNGHPFWRRPQLELQRELSEREARLFALFIPWNVGVHVRLAELAEAPPACTQLEPRPPTCTQLEPREDSAPRPPRRPREPATSRTDDRPSKRLRRAEVQRPVERCEQSAPRRVDSPQSERAARRGPRNAAGASLPSASRASVQEKLVVRPKRQRGAARRVPPAVSPRAPREVKAAAAKKQCAPPTPLLLASDEMETSAAMASVYALMQLRMETVRVAASVAISRSRPPRVALSLSVRTGSGEAHSMSGGAAAEDLSSPSEGGVARPPASPHHSAASCRGRGEARRAGRVPSKRVEAEPSLTAKRTQRQRAHERKQRAKCSSCGAHGAAADDGCEGKVLCGRCSAAYRGREYCPVCMVLWRRPDGTEEDAEFINCGVCDGWVHLSCDKISKGTGSQWESTEYRCPRCRASAPGECFISMPKRAPLKACASCGQRPRGGSAHGSIRLPSQGTEDEECAVVCTPCKARWERGEYCSICKVLWRTDEAQMMSCDQCKRWVHASCEFMSQAEMMELLPTDDCCFVCAPCRGAEPGNGLWGSGPTCHSCARRPSAFPPGQSSRAAATSGKSVSLCAPCVDQWDKRRYCPVCCKVPAGDTAHEVGVGMLACDGCQLWIHAACEGLTVAGIDFMRESSEQYLCPGCRKMAPCVGLSVPLVMQTVEAQTLVQEQERISTSELLSTDVIGSSLSTQPAKVDPPGQLPQLSSPANSAIGITDVSTTPKPKTPATHKARAAVSAAGSTSAAQMDPALEQEQVPSQAPERTAAKLKYEQDAAKFASIDASNFEAKMNEFCERMRTVYGSLPFTQNDWKTSILGTLVGLICAQTCRNSWSSIGYANLCATFGQNGGEPNWDLVRNKKPSDLEPCIWHGPYFHKKAECIHGLTTKAFEDFGEGTSFDALYSWESNKIQKYLKSIVGISGKSTACLMLYRMGRVAFAVDANVLRIMTRLGWLKCLGIYATEGLCSADRKAAARVGIVKPVSTSRSSQAGTKRPLHEGTVYKAHLVRESVVCASLRVSEGHVKLLLACPRRTFDISSSHPVAMDSVTPPQDYPVLPPPKLTNGLGDQLSLCSSNTTTKIPKRVRCKKCPACLRPHCGACAACLNMPKFGGSGTMRKSCELRQCVHAQQAIGTPLVDAQSQFDASLSNDLCCEEQLRTASGIQVPLEMHDEDGPNRASPSCPRSPQQSARVTSEASSLLAGVAGPCVPLQSDPRFSDAHLPEARVMSTFSTPSTPKRVSGDQLFCLTTPCVQREKQLAPKSNHLTYETHKRSLMFESDQQSDTRPEMCTVSTDEHLNVDRDPCIELETPSHKLPRREHTTPCEKSASRPHSHSFDKLSPSKPFPEAHYAVAPAILLSELSGSLTPFLPSATCVPPNALAYDAFPAPLSYWHLPSCTLDQSLTVDPPIFASQCPVPPVLSPADGLTEFKMQSTHELIDATVPVLLQAAKLGQLDGGLHDKSGVPFPWASSQNPTTTTQPRPLETVGMSSERWRNATPTATVRIVGGTRMYCRQHHVYHVCDWTRQRVQEMALAQAARADADDNSASRPQVGVAGASAAAIENDSILPSPMPIATNSDSTHHTPQANALSAPSTFEPKSSLSTADIEDLPKPLKRFSKRAQQYMEDILPTETEPYSRLHGLLYRAHVFMITHGAVLCGETPQCHGCPMREICEYGSLLRSDGHACDSSHVAPVVTPHAAQAALHNVSQTSEKLALEHIHQLAASEMVARVLDTVLSSLSDSEDTSRPSYNLSSEPVGDAAIANDCRAAEEDPGGKPMDDGPFDAATLEAAAQEAASSLLARAFTAALRTLGPPSSTSSSRVEVSSTRPTSAPHHLLSTALPDTLSEVAAEAWMKSIMGTKSTGADTQLCVALEVLDERFAPQHPGDMTPRLLLVHNTIGDYAEGRLLMSPWTAFRGIFPMHGTYFFQNEVFEDEGAGKVRLPLEALGRERPVYIGKSVEGVLRHRRADELSKLFRFGFVCIRRFRSHDGRLLPLVLDQPRLLKYNAMPSNLAQQVGLLPAPRDASFSHQAGSTGPLGGPVANGNISQEVQNSESQEITSMRSSPVPAVDDGEFNDALRRGMQLFSIYIDAGGALCMRQTVWRRIMAALHPDRGGHVRVFQQISALKRLVDAGETYELPQPAPRHGNESQADRDADVLEIKLRNEMHAVANPSANSPSRYVT